MDEIIKIVAEHFPDFSDHAQQRIATILKEAKPVTPEEALAERLEIMRQAASLQSYGIKVCQRLFGHDNLDEIKLPEGEKFLEETDFQTCFYLVSKNYKAWMLEYV